MALIRRADAQEATRDALVLDLGDLVRQGEAILKQARTRAASLLEDAQKERERLIAGAKELGRAEGFAAGREEGLAKGREEGKAQAVEATRTQIDALAATWTAALDEFSGQRDILNAQARQDVLKLAIDIAQRVTRRSIAADPKAVEASLETVFSLVLRPTAARIQVNPADEALTRELLPGLLARFNRVRDAQIIPDAAIERGGCSLRTEGGASINADIAVQLDRIAEALLPGATAS